MMAMWSQVDMFVAMFTENTIRPLHLIRVHDNIQLHGSERYAPNHF